MDWIPEAKSNLRNIETGLLGMSRPEWSSLISYTEGTITLLDAHAKGHSDVSLLLLDARLLQMKGQLELLYTAILRRDPMAATSYVRSVLELMSHAVVDSNPLQQETLL